MYRFYVSALIKLCIWRMKRCLYQLTIQLAHKYILYANDCIYRANKFEIE
jgi:hypothetical protein